MSKQSRYLPLTKLEAGMVLAHDLLDKMGHVLLPAGVTLSDATIKSIAHHDVHLLSVVSDAGEQIIDVEELQRQLKRIDYLFRHASNEGAMQTLRQFIVHYREGLTS
ncbi:hypothetical protein [Undibacterium rugosum]|uniref:Uncharacterized protein n=1 Tax=Undibacterium rugosum TaxID=2762291 RepID=A0A923HYM7_9BURK|nr:hypothetical protein [Undibacterium rugosum]MBC3934583.1 hypothetical protein [Undibacterium rugosum]MBR7777197.1 hypothetical protein [Undibacterium rugosum]